MKVGLVIDSTSYDQFLNIIIGKKLDTIVCDPSGTIRGIRDLTEMVYIDVDRLYDDNHLQSIDGGENKYFLGSMIRHCYEQGWFSEKKGEIVILDDEKAKPILGYLSL